MLSSETEHFVSAFFKEKCSNKQTRLEWSKRQAIISPKGKCHCWLPGAESLKSKLTLMWHWLNFHLRATCSLNRDLYYSHINTLKHIHYLTVLPFNKWCPVPLCLHINYICHQLHPHHNSMLFNPFLLRTISEGSRFSGRTWTWGERRRGSDRRPGQKDRSSERRVLLFRPRGRRD